MAIARRCLSIISLMLLSSICIAQPPREVAVLVVTEGLTIHRLAEWNIPKYRQLEGIAAVGLMNNKTEGFQNFGNNAVTIGAGTRGAGLEYSSCAYNADEQVDGQSARQLFELNTGLQVPRDAVVQLGIAPILQTNTYQRYEIIPGILGQQMQDAGVKVFVYGNSDQGPIRSRVGATIAMNSKGWVHVGDVGANTVVADFSWPYKVRTNYEYIRRQLEGLPEGRSWVVVELGDSRRIDAWKPNFMLDRYERLKRIAATETISFVVALDKYLQSTTNRYMLVFAVVAQDLPDVTTGDRLTPVFVTGTGIDQGLLASPTTRRSGLITNLDLAPSLLSFFKIAPHRSMLGNCMDVVASSDSLAVLNDMNSQMVSTFNARIPVLVMYITLVVLAVIMGILALTIPRQHNRVSRRILGVTTLKCVFVSLMLMPIAFLVAPGLGIYSAASTAIFVVLASLLVSIALNLVIRNPWMLLAVIGTVIAIPLILDLLTGSKLLQKSVLSYDPIAGIRFYGLGNETAGIVISTAILAVCSFLDQMRSIRILHMVVAGLLFAGVIAIIGAPGYGTDFGGMLTAMAAFGFTIAKMNGRVSLRKMLLWSTLGGTAILILILASHMVLDPSKQSHIGHAFTQAEKSGPLFLLDIAIRKWSMNLRLIQSSVWSVVLFSLIIGLGILFRRPAGIMKHSLGKHTVMNAGFMGMLVGIIVAMITNDSGVSMAATSMIFLTLPLILLAKVEMDAFGEVSEHPAPNAQPLKK